MSALKLCALVRGDAQGPLLPAGAGAKLFPKSGSFSLTTLALGRGFKVAVGCIYSCLEAFSRCQMGVSRGLELVLSGAETFLKAGRVSESGELQVCGCS